MCKDAMTIIRDIYALNRDLLDKLGDLESVVLAQRSTGSPKLPTADEICVFNKVSVDSNYGGVVKETLEAIRQLWASA